MIPTAEKRRQLTLLTFAALIVVLIAVGTIWYRNYSQDDVYITYRYSRSIATGQGFVFNTGENVLGTTTPLFALLMAAVYSLTPDLIHAGNLVSAVSLAGVCLLTFKLGERIGGSWLGAGATMMLALNTWFYISFGMETLTYTLLLTGAFWFASRDQDSLAGVCAGLLAVTRADGILLSIVLGLAAIAARRRIPWSGALTAAAIAGSWYFYAWAAFGTPLPQTFNAKVQLLSGWLFIKDGLDWFRWLYLDGSPLYLAAPALWLIGAAASARRRSYLIVLWAWSAIYFIAYTILNVSAFWYYAPLLPAVVLTMGYGAMIVWQWSANWSRSSWIRKGLAAAALAALLIGQARTAHAYRSAPPRVETYRVVGEWLADHTPPDSRILVGDLGVVSWYSGRPTIDVPGLVVPDMHSHTETYALLKYQPDYVIATQYWSWAAILDKQWLAKNYQRVTQISTSGDSGFSPMIIYRRRFPMPRFNSEFKWNEWTVRAGVPDQPTAWGRAMPIMFNASAPKGNSAAFEWPICLLRSDGAIIAQQRAPFFSGEYPAPTTLGDEQIADVVWIDLPEGSESLTAEIWLGENCAAPVERLGAVKLIAPLVKAARQQIFGNILELTDASIPGSVFWSGGEVPLALRWIARSAVSSNYSVFVHLLDSSGALAAQSDGWPGGIPTAALSPNQTLTDARALQLSPDLPAGEYRVQIGLYDPATGRRESLPNGADAVEIGRITVKWPGGSGLP